MNGVEIWHTDAMVWYEDIDVCLCVCIYSWEVGSGKLGVL
jgi:hypothetical protein